MTPHKLAVMAIAAFASLFAPSPTQAQNHKLVFTEESSSLLTVTLDGSPFGTIVNTSPDHWSWDTVYLAAPKPITGPFITLDFGHLAWEEPGNETGTNYVSTIHIVFEDTKTTMQWNLVSDSFTTAPSAPDGTLGGTFSFGTDHYTGLGPTDVYFNDHSDAPDGGATLGMLFVAVLGMFGVLGSCGKRKGVGS
jgi:hypothetical protein